MADTSIVELSDRVRALEREVAAIRTRVVEPDGNGNWVAAVSGSMKDFPQESFDEIMAAGRAIVDGEAAESGQT